MEAPTTTQNDTERSKTFTDMDVLDERQITEELNGHILAEYFYTVNGKWGLSYAGIKAVAMEYAKQGHPISVIHLQIQQSEDGKTYRADAIAQDLSTLEKRTGSAEVERFIDEEGKKPRPFAYTLAGSKAQRNAIRHFLPETVIQSARATFEGKTRPRDITADAKISDPNQKTVPCRSCGKDIIFVTEGTKKIPRNPDGSRHDDP